MDSAYWGNLGGWCCNAILGAAMEMQCAQLLLSDSLIGLLIRHMASVGDRSEQRGWS